MNPPLPILPTCAICNRTVERATVRDDLETGERVVRVYCHGEMDEVRVTEICGIGAQEILFGPVAFRSSPQIESSPPAVETT